MYDVDAVGLLSRELLRERLPALVAESCAWAVGLSDRPHLLRRHGRLVDTGVTLGVRAQGDQCLDLQRRLPLRHPDHLDHVGSVLTQLVEQLRPRLRGDLLRPLRGVDTAEVDPGRSGHAGRFR